MVYLLGDLKRNGLVLYLFIKSSVSYVTSETSGSLVYELDSINTCESRIFNPRINNGSFLHITVVLIRNQDIHVDPEYLPNTDPSLLCHRTSSTLENNVAGIFGTLGSRCDSPVPMVEKTFSFMEKHFYGVDFIIYTGDTARHDRDSQLLRSDKYTLADHRRVVKYFNSTFNLSKTLIIPTIGNNDVLWHNQLAEKDSLFTKLLELWKPFKGLDILKRGPARDSFLLGGYWLQSLPRSQNFKIINLNSMFFYIANKELLDCDNPKSTGRAQLEWLEKTFKELKQQKIKAYVMGHVPPRDEQNRRILYEACYDRLIHLIGSYSDTVISVFWGHTNFDTISFITKNRKHEKYKFTTLAGKLPGAQLDEDIVSVMTTGPSITPVHHPSLRHYIYAPNNGDLMGYTQYYANLTNANTYGSLDFRKEYSTWDNYHLSALRIFNWRRFLPVLMSNQNLWAKYQHFQTVGSKEYLKFTRPNWNTSKKL